MARLIKIGRCNTLSFTSQFKLCKSLVTSILLYGCETWTMLAHSEKRIQAFETKCLRKLLRISYLEHKTNDRDQRAGSTSLWVHRNLFWQLSRDGNLHGSAMSHDILSKTILHCTLDSGRRRGRQRKCWLDNIKEWTSLPMPEVLTRASCRTDWKRISAESSLMSHDDSPPDDPTELNWGCETRIVCGFDLHSFDCEAALCAKMAANTTWLTQPT